MSTADAPTGAAAVGLVYYQSPSVTRGTRALSLRADYLRSNIDVLGGEVQDLHGEARELDLQARAFEKGKASVASLLAELSSSRGMGWSDIAAIVGVSVSAVRKWRHGGEASPERRAALARVAAFLDVIEEKGLVEEPARWMEMALPLPPGYYIRPLDLYLDGATMELVDLVEQRKPMEQVLDEARPGWRDQRSQLEVFEGSDKQRALRLRES